MANVSIILCNMLLTASRPTCFSSNEKATSTENHKHHVLCHIISTNISFLLMFSSSYFVGSPWAYCLRVLLLLSHFAVWLNYDYCCGRISGGFRLNMLWKYFFLWITKIQLKRRPQYNSEAQWPNIKILLRPAM